MILLRKFADDFKIANLIESVRDCHVLQSHLDSVNLWCGVDMLFLNTSKCFIVSYCRKKIITMFDYQIDNHLLTRCDEMKDLCVVLDKSLKFKTHINNIIKAASEYLGFIIRNSRN
nr:unnamed protein product [Callosobruchus analis]CAI5851164.1 unnamed protein product [Callosobruchus analis]